MLKWQFEVHIWDDSIKHVVNKAKNEVIVKLSLFSLNGDAHVMVAQCKVHQFAPKTECMYGM